MRTRSIKDVAAAVRGRRQDLGLNQAELARRVGVSRKWIYEFEGGKPKAEFALVLRVLDELGLTLDIDDSPTPPSPETVDLDAILDEHRDQ
ncbi:MAG TPA: helix-turn-helix transcriptional regulator [Acidimicrobiales bacterium]|jgi:HTH-type transcriptional regulator/antitoxin HipB